MFETPALKAIAKQNQNFIFVVGDITDINFVFELLNFGADFVLHVAALIDISLSYEKIAKVNVESVKYIF